MSDLHHTVLALVENPTVDQFVGGQFEIQNKIEGYIARGEIEEVCLKPETPESYCLYVRFKWVVEADFDMMPTSEWRLGEKTEYAMTLFGAVVSWLDIPDSKMDKVPKGSKRLCVNSLILNELVVLFPKGESDFKPPCVPAEFNPDWRVHPGATLRELVIHRIIDDFKFTRQEEDDLVRELDEILQNKGKITERIATILEQVFKVNRNFWLNLQANYDKPRD